jgi:molybdenum cofactor cytidylyltransferase
VVAAGRSTRMAPRNKLLEKIDGETMVRRVTRLALASSAKPVVVVTGFEADRVGAALHGLDVRLVHNPSYAEGLSTSLRAGLAALPSSCDGALICLADMPWVKGSVLQALITAFAADGPHSICVPTHHGRQGNPVLWGSAYFPEMMSLSGDSGARPIMARQENHVVAVEVSTDSIFADADAPSDLPRSS